MWRRRGRPKQRMAYCPTRGPKGQNCAAASGKFFPYTPRMKNQIEKKMENDMEAAIYVYIRLYTFFQSLAKVFATFIP